MFRERVHHFHGQMVLHHVDHWRILGIRYYTEYDIGVLKYRKNVQNQRPSMEKIVDASTSFSYDYIFKLIMLLLRN